MIQEDAVKLLQQIVAECDVKGEHEWRKCKRCMTIVKIDERDELAIKLLRVAISEIQG